MADISSWLGPLASVITAVGAIPLGRLAVNRRERRVGTSIDSTLKTIKDVDEAGLSETTGMGTTLQGALANDLDALAKLIEERNREKPRNYASLAVSVFPAALITIPMWFLWRPESGLTWTIFITLAVTAGFVILLGGFACFNPTTPTPKTDTPPTPRTPRTNGRQKVSR